MRFTPDNFLYMVKQLVTGVNGVVNRIGGGKAADGGIKHENFVSLSNVSGALDGQITDNTTGTASTTFAAIAGTTYATDAPAIKNALAQIAKSLNKLDLGADTNSFPAIVVATGTTAIGSVNYAIPRDYDEASDLLVIRVQAAITAGDVAVPIQLQGTLSYLLPGGTPVSISAVKATLPFLTATANLSGTEATYEILLSGQGLKRDSLINVVLALSGATSAGPAYIYGVEVLYDSTIVSYNDTDSTGIDNSLGEYGNPLR